MNPVGFRLKLDQQTLKPWAFKGTLGGESKRSSMEQQRDGDSETDRSRKLNEVKNEITVNLQGMRLKSGTEKLRKYYNRVRPSDDIMTPWTLFLLAPSSNHFPIKRRLSPLGKLSVKKKRYGLYHYCYNLFQSTSLFSGFKSLKVVTILLNMLMDPLSSDQFCGMLTRFTKPGRKCTISQTRFASVKFQTIVLGGC